jgi:transcriptional regulator with XRE-family HTH domain
MQQSIESIPARIAERVRDRRLALGWSRATLAARAAVSAETLRAFERTGQISLPRLARLAVALGVDAELERLFSAPPPVQSLDELAAQSKRRQRGR